ncbi:hypothetical protein DNTS_013842 [Danionella cerebrum]|uniref:Uncharacterized protein n=1 Tax=Danionella cerebrum TaxID=2873325 RepID=A0A553QM33_9TELE|nr:hypothetical protein DNTS_013842 [Danionella translucida]
MEIRHSQLSFESVAHMHTLSLSLSLSFSPSSFSPAFGLQRRGDLTNTATTDDVPEKCKPACHRCFSKQLRQTGISSQTRAALSPRRRVQKASLRTADAKPSPSAEGSHRHAELEKALDGKVNEDKQFRQRLSSAQRRKCRLHETFFVLKRFEAARCRVMELHDAHLHFTCAAAAAAAAGGKLSCF